MISTVRWLVMCARGVFAVQRYFVITMFVDAVRGEEQRGRAAGRPAADDQDVGLDVLTMRLLGREHDVVADSVQNGASTVAAVGRRARLVLARTARSASSLHAEDGVVVEVLVAGDEDVRGQRLRSRAR